MSYTYKLLPRLTADSWDTVLRIEDNVGIPCVQGNSDYQQYLEWVAEGNTPEPADSAD
jgi:hypothetical protein